MEPIVLEEWLVAARSPLSAVWSTAPATPFSTPSTADFAVNGVVQAWAQIRVCVQERRPLTTADSAAFDTLIQHLRHLHVADTQAKLLLAVLTDLRAGDDPSLLGNARRFAVLGLLGWVRKSFMGSASTAAFVPGPGNSISNSKKQQASETLTLTLSSIVSAVCGVLEERPLSNAYTCESILLLGILSTLPLIPAAVRIACSTAVAVQLNDHRDVVVRGAIAEALAGAGYALSVASQEHVARIFRALLSLWATSPLVQTAGDRHVEQNAFPRVAERFSRLGWPNDSGERKKEEDCPNLKDVVMILHLMDYLGAIFFPKLLNSQHADPSQIELVHACLIEVLNDQNYLESVAVQCSTIMAASGLLRSSYRLDDGNMKPGIVAPAVDKCLVIMRNLEAVVVRISEQAVAPDTREIFEPISATASIKPLDARTQQLRRCVSLAVGRCRGLPAHSSILRCTLVSVLGDALNMDEIYPALTADLVSRRFGLDKREQKVLPCREDTVVLAENVRDLDSTLDCVGVHVDGYYFQEIGTVARALCDQYSRASEESQEQAEHMISDYARNLYEMHRVLVASSPVPLKDLSPLFVRTLEKVFEAAFFTVVIFFSTPVRNNISEKNHTSRARLAALALDSLSCVEYFRHVKLREFSRLVQRSVSYIFGSETGSTILAQLLPSYQDIIQRPGKLHLKLLYRWDQDEVQTSRILFSFRVLPLCFTKMPEVIFATEVAPVMFLYMQHPLQTVSKASHALFAAFLSLGLRAESSAEVDDMKSMPQLSPNAERKPGMTLREQLVVFYMQRTLQVFPAVTPFEGLVAGVGTIVRQMPPGSPATVHCLNCLVEKAAVLYNTDSQSKNSEDLDVENPQAESPGRSKGLDTKFHEERVRAAQKLHILLLHLTLLVDLQVLPTMLKLMAKLILGLPKHFHTEALADAFDVVGGTDDYTRKPILVPWLQSLSYLLFNIQGSTDSGKPSSEEVGEISSVPSSSNLAKSTKTQDSISNGKTSASAGNEETTDLIGDLGTADSVGNPEIKESTGHPELTVSANNSNLNQMSQVDIKDTTGSTALEADILTRKSIDENRLGSDLEIVAETANGKDLDGTKDEEQTGWRDQLHLKSRL